MRRTAEPEPASDATSSSYAPRGPSGSPNNRELSAHQRQLFDHRKDDPVRFSVMARPSSTNGGRPTPTPKASADYVSASSTSSYAPSIAALFDRKPSEEPGNNVFAVQLKKLYRGISSLETRILTEDAEDAGVDEGRVLLKTREKEVVDEDAEKQKWRKRIDDHKRLAEMMHNLLEISLAPSVPASLRNIPTKYNIIIRLWSHAFHKLLESLRRASFASPLALKHLQDFIYYAYTFYTGILEEHFIKLPLSTPIEIKTPIDMSFPPLPFISDYLTLCDYLGGVPATDKVEAIAAGLSLLGIGWAGYLGKRELSDEQMICMYAEGFEPARLARIGQAYYYGPDAMEVDGVSDQKAAVSLVVYWGLCAKKYRSEELVQVWWEGIADWEHGSLNSADASDI
ncbi:hypothetical protein FIBSPDRAFT_947410 [Athelia psychrophila]|uniref:Uncharacterized protein n=1 Tax=Athelia psychrophila TaxID=1759441 RepID=A0A166RRL7_9AGAM|nr:hypothetical protein FIBSPDRAFT_947410 [Fibularhizoctonia sp. CBS 109695]